ncbi:MAG TPA: DoxX family protein [Vicinamibacteria bacterium]|nr:DoxX family protein [Vicinamibacteria bacterium]
MRAIARVDVGLLILRLAGLYLALAHGLEKVTGLSTGQSRFPERVAALGFPAPELFAWAAALSEFGGGLLIAVGLFTRWAALFAAFTMFVAGFVRHRALGHFLSWIGIAPVSEKVLEAWDDPETALVYLLAFVALALVGPGRLSIDARRAHR